MTDSPAIVRCRWIERNGEGIHELCPAEAVFAVEVDVPTAEGVEKDHLWLCAKHAPQAPTGLARPPA